MAKMAVNKIENIYNKTKVEPKNIVCNIDGEEVTITVKPMLTIKEMLGMVNSVCDAVSIGVDGTYRPELLDYYIRMEVIENYTNIKLPDNLEKSYNIVYGTGLFELITTSDENDDEVFFNGAAYCISFINKAQYAQMLTAINKKISFVADKMYNKSRIDTLLEGLVGMVNNMDTNYSGVDFKAILGKISQMDNVINSQELAKTVMELSSESKESKVIPFAPKGDSE